MKPVTRMEPIVLALRTAMLPHILAILWASPLSVAAVERSFYNTIGPNGADPWVLRHTDGRYYLMTTTGSDLVIRRSTSLVGIAAGERKTIRGAQSGGESSKEVWAPELHWLDDKWYVYFAASNGNNSNHRMFVLENDSPDPFEGEFREKGKICDPQADRWAIDGTVLDTGRQRYFLWSGWEGSDNVRQNLYIARMSNPWTLDSPRVEISRPTLPWETIGDPDVNEAPQVLIRGKTVCVIYSASGSWTDDYCLGLLTANLDADLLERTAWTKAPAPVFRRSDRVFGPGHCSFTRSPNGREDWIVFHAARYQGAGWERSLRMQPFRWNKNNLPEFGAPVPPGRLIPLPGGEPAHQRLEAEAARHTGKVKSAPLKWASGKAKVGHLDTADSSVRFSARAASAGPHVMSVRFSNGTANKAAATHRVTVNSGAEQIVRYPNSGWDKFSNAFLEIQLERGMNTIVFQKGEGFAELDCIDLWPLPDRKPAAAE